VVTLRFLSGRTGLASIAGGDDQPAAARAHRGSPSFDPAFAGLWEDRRVATVNSIATGQRALAAGDWTGARSAFEQALADGETAEALDGLGQALWWLNEPAEALELRQRAYAEFVRRRERPPAIGIAVFLAREFFTVHGNLAATTGWLARAQSLLEEEGACPQVVWLELTRGGSRSIRRICSTTRTSRSGWHDASASASWRSSRLAWSA
jgi:tetratricopeptide (TPR) repeat protein